MEFTATAEAFPLKDDEIVDDLPEATVVLEPSAPEEGVGGSSGAGTFSTTQGVDIWEFGGQYTIEHVGDVSPFPVFRFLVYEKGATKLPDDEFTLTIGCTKLGPIQRSEYTRSLEWRPGVFLTELNFFTVLGNSNTCLPLDTFRPCEVGVIKIHVKYIHTNSTTKISVTRVFGWCRTARWAQQNPPPATLPFTLFNASSSSKADSGTRRTTTYTHSPPSKNTTTVLQLLTNSTSKLQLQTLCICRELFTLSRVMDVDEKVRKYMQTIIALQPGDYITFKVSAFEAQCAALYAYIYTYTRDQEDDSIIVGGPDDEDATRFLRQMIQRLELLLRWRTSAQRDPELAHETMTSIHLVRGTTMRRCALVI